MALYGGRIEPDNGCEEMLEYFDAYAENDGDTALVLMGVKMMKVPDEPYVRQAGVLPDRERMVAYEAADVTIAPGADDPLALSVLESFAVGTPVLACARNAAEPLTERHGLRGRLRDHERSVADGRGGRPGRRPAGRGAGHGQTNRSRSASGTARGGSSPKITQPASRNVPPAKRRVPASPAHRPSSPACSPDRTRT